MSAANVSRAGRPTEKLVEDLARSGLEVDRNLVEELLGRGTAALPCLAQILDEEKYWRHEKDVGDGWAPIGALHLLAAIANPDGCNLY